MTAGAHTGAEVGSGPAPSAQLCTPAELVPHVRRRANAIRDALNDRTLHGHRARDIPKARWLVPLVCALAWVAGRDETAQAAVCPLCLAAGPAPAPNRVASVRALPAQRRSRRA